MQELQHKESWAPKNWWFWAVVLRKTLQSPLDSKETQPVHPKENQSWIFIGRTEAEAEAVLLWPTDWKNWLIGKDPDAEKTEVWGEGDNRGWDVWLASLIDGHEFEQSLGVGDGQERLMCCSPWGCKESNTTEWLNCSMFSLETSLMAWWGKKPCWTAQVARNCRHPLGAESSPPADSQEPPRS